MKKICLFYVDDDNVLREVVSQMLSTESRFELITFSGATETLNRLQRGEKCDVLITDCNMPEMSGYELVSAMRADERFKNIRILMLTINNELEDVAHSLKAGANEYLMKPFDKEMLLNKVDLLLRD
jgi:two-component system chemotaxis response regulator CheY